MSDLSSFDDKRVLITGGADGIGLALARALRDAGAQVFLSDIAADRLDKSANALEVPSAVCDVTDEAAVSRLVEHAWQSLGSIDLLCANAGVVAGGPLLEAPREEIDWQFGVNVWGVLNACRAYVRAVRAAGGGGHILMTGSETSLSSPGFVRPLLAQVYTMTKHCVLAMGDVLRTEVEPDGIGVSVLCPGPVATRLGQNSAGLREQRGSGAPAQAPQPSAEFGRDVASRTRSADDVARVALDGLRSGLFVIPTHPHIRDDVAERFREIEQGLDAL